ncbi:MAG TPA: endonuclease NucS domain-containing protein [Parafilimonas sp.]|nr:endonuclease NucS domain-containing protein [Parafilimonas sp.]
MSAKIFYLLEELKNNYSEQTLTEIITTFQDEVIVDDLFTDLNRAKNAFNGQNKNLYKQLSILFLQDLNEVPEMYFSLWEGIFDLLNDNEFSLFLDLSLENYNDGDADDYINGMIRLENGSPEIALFYFNRIDHYVASYFIGLCYLNLENHENAILQFEIFLENLELTLKAPNLEDETGLTIAKWNALNHLGYLYNRVEEYKKAKNYYENGLEVFSVEETFFINNENHDDKLLDEFAIWTNNYVLSLEKTGEIQKCITTLKFAISKRPTDYYFIKQLARFEEKLKNKSFADGIINKLFKKKQPFNIQQFEATKSVSKEKSLEDMIVEQIKYGFKVFGKELEIYKDKFIYGRQYHISSVNRRLDLLLIDKLNNQLYLVELKRNEAGVEVVEQIEKYIDGLSKELNQNIKGIICLHKPDSQLTELVKTKENIELYTYGFDFNKLG